MTNTAKTAVRYLAVNKIVDSHFAGAGYLYCRLFCPLREDVCVLLKVMLISPHNCHYKRQHPSVESILPP